MCERLRQKNCIESPFAQWPVRPSTATGGARKPPPTRMASVTSLRKLLDAIIGDNGSTRSKFIDGTTLSCLSTVTLGQPFEVWKTRMGRHRLESTSQAFWKIMRAGGVRAFYVGTGPKLVESATKGGVLLVAKDAVERSLKKAGVASTTAAAFIGGAFGGIAQTVVMGPCTFLVTALVLSNNKHDSASSVMRRTWTEKGLRGFYPGGSAIAARQASNWASRVGFTEAVRSRIASVVHGDPRHRLSISEECWAGILGGVLSCWNHPFEVARIEMQARALHGEEHKSMLAVLRGVHAEHGVRGLFQGLLPRMGTNVWLTLFMLSGANIVKQLREGSELKAKEVEEKAKRLARRTMTGTVMVGSSLGKSVQCE